MITFTVNTETRDALAAALDSHGADRLANVGLGRIKAYDTARATAAIVAAWPTAEDGMHRISLSDTAGFINWRAFILSEVAAGRGKLDDHLQGYCQSLGISTVQAYDYVCAAAKGLGIRPCKDADHDAWSAGVRWVALSGNVADPRRTWARSAWHQRARAHEVLAAAGLTYPIRNTWTPVATCLFVQPKRDEPRPTLSLADEAAIARFA